MGNVLECKICGGNIVPNGKLSFGECESCGARTAITKTNPNKFNRANYLRRVNEFDQAISVFQEIVEENPEDAEAHWGLVLCRFGIEYVDDVDGGKKPTCHRTVLDSILSDPDYLAALECGDPLGRELYEEEAKRIDAIQTKIKAIVANESPYEVFLCYRESENGQRTRDSLDVQEIYNRLTAKGFQVFYARKTLQDKIGEEYEPLIFAALSSAKVMVAYGSKPGYFQSVWVKNEWSRFRKMMKGQPEKKIIPVYDGAQMTAYDLPNELADFQAFDKYKVGFLEDLVEGLEKILLESEGLKETALYSASKVMPQAIAAVNIENMLQRAFIALEEQEYDRADYFLEQVLNENVKEPHAYIGKLLASVRKPNEDALVEGMFSFKNHLMYQRALQFSENTPYHAHVQEIYNRYEKFVNSKIPDILAGIEEAKKNWDYKAVENGYYTLFQATDEFEYLLKLFLASMGCGETLESLLKNRKITAAMVDSNQYYSQVLLRAPEEVKNELEAIMKKKRSMLSPGTRTCLGCLLVLIGYWFLSSLAEFIFIRFFI